MKLAFVHIPKTAGGTIKYWFRSGSQSNNFIYAGHKLLTDFNIPYDESFCVIRNTFDRLISLYAFSKITAPRKLRKKLSRGKLEEAAILQNTVNVINKGIHYWLEYHIENRSLATLPLSTWTKGVDHILRSENLDEDFVKIQERMNDFRKIEKNVHVLEYDRDQFLDTKLIKIIKKNYEEEIDRYGYTAN